MEQAIEIMWSQERLTCILAMIVFPPVTVYFIYDKVTGGDAAEMFFGALGVSAMFIISGLLLKLALALVGLVVFGTAVLVLGLIAKGVFIVIGVIIGLF